MMWFNFSVKKQISMLCCNYENQCCYLTSSFVECTAAQERLTISVGWSPAMSNGQRHGIISILDSSQTLELSWGAIVSSMTILWKALSRYIAKTFNAWKHLQTMASNKGAVAVQRKLPNQDGRQLG